MSPAPTRDTPAGRAYNDLRNLARREGRDPAEFLTFYALEGFLARLAVSQHVVDFVLKGGVLMAAFAARRPTRDIDLAAIGISNDIPDVEDRVRSIVTGQRDDGLTFDPGSVMGEAIRDDADDTGVRVKVTAQFGDRADRAARERELRRPDLARPAEGELPLLLGGTLRVRGYPGHMVLAEKIVTAIDDGPTSPRLAHVLPLLVDTSTWLDLARRRDGQKWIVAIRLNVHWGNLQLLVPSLVVGEFRRNRPRIQASMTASVAECFRQMRQDFNKYGGDTHEQEGQQPGSGAGFLHG